MKNLNVLVADDEIHQRNSLAEFLRDLGAKVTVAGSGQEALQLINSTQGLDLVISDLKMPDLDGLSLLKRVKATRPEIDFVIVTAHGTIDSAIEAVQAGACDYFQKPLEFDEVKFRLQKVSDLKKLTHKNQWLADENKRLSDSPGSSLGFRSPLMVQLLSDLGQVVDSDATVLLTGETGVGKEVIARHIHTQSPRKTQPFVAVNCGAIPENLLESQFFGHEKGAFTGADRRSIGSFELADGGTLFLDEIGEMDLRLQAKILRALEQRQIQRLGDQNTIDIDIRIVAATNRDLKNMVLEKTFREDLYYRLNVVHFLIPPLRDRKVDIPLLVNEFIGQKIGSRKKDKIIIDSEFMSSLTRYTFPGNIRELKNLIERALLFAKNGVLTVQCLPTDFHANGRNVQNQGVVSGQVLPMNVNLSGISDEVDLTLAERVGNFERDIIRSFLDRFDHDVEATAKALKVSRSALYAKLSKYGIS